MFDSSPACIGLPSPVKDNYYSVLSGGFLFILTILIPIKTTYNIYKRLNTIVVSSHAQFSIVYFHKPSLQWSEKTGFSITLGKIKVNVIIHRETKTKRQTIIWRIVRMKHLILHVVIHPSSNLEKYICLITTKTVISLILHWNSLRHTLFIWRGAVFKVKSDKRLPKHVNKSSYGSLG